MKKLAVAFLSVFMILGGVLLAACDSKVSLTLLTNEEITIYTNDEQAENFEKDQVDVRVDNSSDGIRTEILKGTDLIQLSDVTKKASGRYSFEISTLTSKKSGEAEVKITAIEDSSQSQIITVNVKTILEGLDAVQNDSVNASSNNFVVKSPELSKSTKTLLVADYFELNPVTANDYQIGWVIDNGTTDGVTELKSGVDTIAQIDGNKLWVSDKYNGSTIVIKAKDITKGVSNSVTLDVLDNTTIEAFTFADTVFYEGGQLVKSEENIVLKRNNSKESNAAGELVINSNYDVVVEPVVYLGDKKLSRAEYEKYIIFNITDVTKDEITMQSTYAFTVDALDVADVKESATLKFFLNVAYKDYKYGVLTGGEGYGSTIEIRSFYQATRIELYNEKGEALNESNIDVFSNYVGEDGYKIQTTLLPDDVAIDDNSYYLSIDASQTVLNGLTDISQFARFYSRGEEISFTNNAGDFVSEQILNTTSLYVVASGIVDTMENVEIDFISTSNQNAKTSVVMNFYKISTGEILDVKDKEGNQIVDPYYISSSEKSVRTMDLQFKIYGLTTTSGLSVNTNNPKFIFDNITLISSDVDSILVGVTVSLNQANFEESATFSFEHISGKESGIFNINSFIPIVSASVSNGDKVSASVFKDEATMQNYIIVDGAVQTSETYKDNSLSRLMLEAGATLPIETNIYNATLKEPATYKYLSYDNLKLAIADIEGIAELEDVDLRAKEIFQNSKIMDNIFAMNYVPTLEYISKHFYDYFEDVDSALFTIAGNKLILRDVEFKGYVASIYTGYGENHEALSLIRFFALESFNSVHYLASNVSTAKLYTVDTLSYLDVARSYVDVTLNFRSDLKTPTYTNDLSMFTFVSANSVAGGNSDPFVITNDDGSVEVAEADGSFVPSDLRLSASNSYYTLSDFVFTNSYRSMRFRITADTTKMLSQVRDILTITYQDENGFVRQAEIQIEIKNVNRIEGVEWTTQTIDKEIYFNATSIFQEDKNFTITTYCTPSDANDGGLSYWYDSIAGVSNGIIFTPSESGQTYNLRLNTTMGGYGDLYLLPNDMVKSVNGLQYVLLYKYTTDEDGEITETAVLKKLSEIGLIYENLVDETKTNSEFDQYFYNNEGEKIFYKDILLKIRIVIADGLGEQTAVRVYTQSDLESVDYAKFYRVMNDITLSGWETLSATNFSGTIFGNNENITLRFTDSSKTFIDKIGSTGVVKDLTFVGEISNSDSEYCGFVANQNSGTIQNVKIDVDYASNQYKSSVINAGAVRVGGLVGRNEGRIVDSANYGLTINVGASISVGGLVGENNGTISGSAVEFYDYVDALGAKVPNKITSTGSIGGLVGCAYSGSVIEKSYVYAYSLVDSTKAYTSIFSGSSNAGAFIGTSYAGVKINQSFAFVGDLKTPFISGTNKVSMTNSYISYYERRSALEVEKIIKTKIFKNEEVSVSNTTYAGGVTLVESDIPTDGGTGSSLWQSVVSGSNALDSTIWQLTDIDATANFGFMHLKGAKQTTPTDVLTLTVANNTEPLKSLSAGVGKHGILFAYIPTVNVSSEVEVYTLNSLNTISVSELFGITEDEAKSLILTTDSKDVSISSNSVRVINANINEFELKVHSKMDFSQSEKFTFVILNNLPKVSMLLDGEEIKNGQTILLQKGDENTRDVIFNLNNALYLGGETNYQTYRDGYTIETAPLTDTNAKVTKSGYKLTLTGLESHTGDSTTKVSTNLGVGGLDALYQTEINKIRSNNFNVSVFDGASAIIVNDATNLTVKPSRYASFETTIVTDNADDNIVLTLNYDNVDILDADTTDNVATFVVDNELTLEASWTETTTPVDDRYNKTFKVIIKVKDDKKHRITKNYDLLLTVNATSISNDDSLAKTLGLKVSTQEVSDISISAYNIESRQVKNSTLYLTPSTATTNTLMPSSDAIVAVVLDPAYSMMTHFKLTYSLTGVSGTIGTINISKLSYNPNYGYYVNTSSTTVVENGLQVYLTETDKTGNGVFYFRVYVSGAFQTESDLKLTLTCYNYETELKTVSHNLNVDYISNATVKVNDVSNYIMSKGSSARVTVTVGLDQDLYDISLQNNGSGITLSSTTVEYFQTYKRYSATLTAYVDATLTNNRTNGTFSVNATVSKVINGVTELKQSRATVCLVDFAIDGNGVKVQSSGGKQTYNGKEYDVFYAYVNAKDSLRFDYAMNPEEYYYDPDDASEVLAVEKLTRARNEFEQNNNYKNEQADYYINYQYNELNGQFNALTLKQQLWYAQDEETATAIYNGRYINQNRMFTIEDNGTSKTLEITGRTSGTQLMKLRTTVYCQGIQFVYDYHFLIVVDVWSDEEAPTQITTAEEFVNYATNSQKSDDYILMNDIVLDNYTPVDTDFFNSLDGNGYTIHINSFAMPEDESKLNLALFNDVDSNTTLKNIRVNIYGGGNLSVDVSKYKTINIAGFAINNNGIIYNCEVVSYYDSAYQTSRRSTNGIVVEYTLGTNTDAIKLTNSMKVTSNVAGFVITNRSSITNSRVGGESFRHILKIDEVEYLKTQETDIFAIQAQGNVAGFVISNGTVQTDEDNVLGSGIGYISACFADNVQINNDMESTSSLTAGFALNNFNYIYGSYVEGARGGTTEDPNDSAYNTGSNISAIGVIAGFVYSNDGNIKNSYANIAIENTESKGSLVSGFVYMNNHGANISLSYAACKISQKDVNEMQFSGVDDFANSLNNGTIEFSYYFNASKVDESNQSKISSGALGVNEITKQDTFYGFSFASSADAYDGIWVLDSDGLTLASANQIAISNRYGVTSGAITNVYYNKNVIDYDTLASINLAYGSDSNPIIIRTAEEFAMATGKAKTKEISYYKEYYNDRLIFGNYRLVKNLDMSIFEQTSEGEDVAVLTTMKKTFEGSLDGNGFTITNISLLSSETSENFGLFAKLDHAVVMNLNMVVKTISNAQSNIVGTIAGTAIDSRLSTITITPVRDTTNSSTSIFGNNVVGGVVGMLFGESKLNDINARNMIVYSSYYKEDKTIGTNSQWTGMNLRRDVENGLELTAKVSHLSYAGAVAGYVDVYKDINDNSLKFNSSLDVSQFNIVTVHVTNAVDIYAEVAGGLFGYIGTTTLVYDATLKLNADSTLRTPSYIISKNLYAGGLIGENYGGLFGVYASYSDDLQKSIEEGENGYYNGNRNAEKGQQSIFSYGSGENIAKKTSNPKFIGGLVGYMGGGYIYIGYNKLNVVSNDSNTLAVGGIVGFAGYKTQKFDLTFAQQSTQTSMLLYEVYSSGDIHVNNENGISAGVIGALESYSGKSSVVALKNVLALNYYSIDGQGLKNDAGVAKDNLAGTELDGKYLASKYFTVAGKVYKDGADTGVFNQTELTDHFYIFRSDDNVYDVYGRLLSGMGVSTFETVGGYTSMIVNKEEIYLDPFGFVTTGSRTEKLANVASVEHIGSANCANISTAYARLYSYFLPVGWTEKFWTHKENNLFPNIELTPKVDVMFLDATASSIQEAIAVMSKGGHETIVVRGMTNPEVATSTSCTDIDLTAEAIEKYEAELGVGIDLTQIKFAGRLVSYYEYMNSTDLGVVTSELPYGGRMGAQVGIIIDSPMFASLEEGASIEAVSFYYAPNNVDIDDDESTPDETVIDYSLVSGEVATSTLTKVNLVVNSDIHYANSTNTAGLIARSVLDTSIDNVTVKFRNNATYTASVTSGEDAVVLATGEKEAYFGILVGKAVQGSEHTRSSIRGIDLRQVDSADNKKTGKDYPVVMNVEDSDGETGYTVYAGLYAGAIVKEGGEGNTIAAINLTVSKLSNVLINISAEKADTVYVGGYVGQVSGLNGVVYDGQNEAVDAGINIIQKTSINQLNAGLMFGDLQNSDLRNFSGSSDELVLKGSITQYSEDGSDIATDIANIGGISGLINSAVELRGISVNFNLAGYDATTKTAAQWSTELDKNLYDYTENLKPYVISGEQPSIGGLFGRANNTITAYNDYDITGHIDVMLTNTTSSNDIVANIGGWIGSTISSVIAVASGTNELDISVSGTTEVDDAGKQVQAKDDYTAYVGGLIGHVQEVEGSSEIEISINESGELMLEYVGDILSSMKTLKAGGAVGYIGRTNYNNDTQPIFIKNYAYGGAIKIYSQNIDEGNVSVGGIVGEFNTLGLDPDSHSDGYTYDIENVYSYGDVFVNYPTGVNTNWKLKAYNFGGIVGKASKLDIANSYSIMTSFNNRLSLSDTARAEGLFGVGEYNIGALVGGNAECVVLKNNYYSSVANMAYQDQFGETQTIDVAYGENGSYVGYGAQKPADETNGSVTSILEKFSNYKTTDEGTKLNPIVITADNVSSINLEDVDEGYKKTNGIYWISVGADIEIDNAVFESLTNVAFVGNGYTITRTDSRKDETAIEFTNQGGLFNNVGLDSERKMDTIEFTMISGLTVKLDVDADFSAIGAVNYGGVAGKMNGNSFVYAVAVKGQASVGAVEDAENVQLSLAGIVGLMENGFINQSYVDADLTYRANQDGEFTGIAQVANYNTTIKACYTSGTFTTYVDDIYMYGLAYGVNKEDNCSHDILNCYSVAPLISKDVEGDGSSVKKGFLNKENSGNSVFSTSENYTLFEIETTESNYPLYTLKTTDEMSVDYYYNGNTVRDSLLVYGKNEGADDKLTHESLTNWFYNPYVNYGYASHGFGFMANVTAYTRLAAQDTLDSSEPDESGFVTKVYTSTGVVRTDKVAPSGDTITTHGYMPVSYVEAVREATESDVLSGWYLGVLNVGKFNHMVDAVKTDPDSADNSSYLRDNANVRQNFDFKFVLRNDLTLKKYSNDKKDDSKNYKYYGTGLYLGLTAEVLETQIINAGGTYSASSNGLEIDGNNKTIDMSSLAYGYRGLFSSVHGHVENLNISNFNTSLSFNSDIIVGALAGTMVGNLNNVATTGNIKVGEGSDATVVGGVVGSLKGNAIAVSNSVNITSEGDRVQYVGGVIGVHEAPEGKSAIIAYSSNNGIINNTEAGYTGGVVGKIGDAVTVRSCYNTNAVLTGYVESVSSLCVAGGIVGEWTGSNATIESCYNTGFVGAGNVGNNEFSFAGGIFGITGYDSSSPRIGQRNVKNCVNEGAVEAIGSTEGAGYTLTAKEIKDSDDSKADINNWTQYSSTGANKISYEVTLAYTYEGDRKEARNVFAYGIGYMAMTSVTTYPTQNIINNYTTTDNIKNEGCIGGTSQTKTITFDRDSMIAGSDYRAQFTPTLNGEGDPAVFINGIDSYGFPTRVYMKDKIIRGYFGDISDKEESVANDKWYTLTDIYLAENNPNSKVQGAANTNLFFDNWSSEFNGIYTYLPNEETGKEDYIGSAAVQAQSEEKYWNGGSGNATKQGGPFDNTSLFSGNDNFFQPYHYILSAETEYYSSAEFDPYNEFIQKQNVVIGFVKDIKPENATSQPDVSGLIGNVAKFREGTLSTTTTINGKSTILASTGTSLSGIYTPYMYTFTTSIDAEDIDTSLFDRSSFLFDYTANFEGEDGKDYPIRAAWTKKGYEIVERDGKTAIDITINTYFSRAVKFNSSEIVVNYTSMPKTITLGKNNVAAGEGENAGYTIVYLVGNGFTLKDIIQKLKDDATYSLKRVTIDDTAIFDFDSGINKDAITRGDCGLAGADNTPYIRIKNELLTSYGFEELDDLNDKDLSIVVEYKAAGHDVVALGAQKSTKSTASHEITKSPTGEIECSNYVSVSALDLGLIDASGNVNSELVSNTGGSYAVHIDKFKSAAQEHYEENYDSGDIGSVYVPIENFGNLDELGANDQILNSTQYAAFKSALSTNDIYYLKPESVRQNYFELDEVTQSAIVEQTVNGIKFSYSASGGTYTATKIEGSHSYLSDVLGDESISDDFQSARYEFTATVEASTVTITNTLGLKIGYEIAYGEKKDGALDTESFEDKYNLQTKWIGLLDINQSIEIEIDPNVDAGVLVSYNRAVTKSTMTITETGGLLDRKLEYTVTYQTTNPGNYDYGLKNVAKKITTVTAEDGTDSKVYVRDDDNPIYAVSFNKGYYDSSKGTYSDKDSNNDRVEYRLGQSETASGTCDFCGQKQKFTESMGTYANYSDSGVLRTGNIYLYKLRNYDCHHSEIIFASYGLSSSISIIGDEEEEQTTFSNIKATRFVFDETQIERYSFTGTQDGAEPIYMDFNGNYWQKVEEEPKVFEGLEMFSSMRYDGMADINTKFEVLLGGFEIGQVDGEKATKNIWLARNDGIELISTIEDDYEQTTLRPEKTGSVKMYYVGDISTEETIMLTKTQTYEYKADEEKYYSEGQIDGGNGHITNELYGSYKYQYRVNTKEELTYPQVQKIDPAVVEKEIEDYDNIVVMKDLYINGLLGYNSRNIYGNNRSITFYGTGEDSFISENNNAIIQDLNIVSIFSEIAANTPGEINPIIKTNEGTLRNISVYGNIRNGTSSVDGVDVRAVGLSMAADGSDVSDLKTYMSIFNLDNIGVKDMVVNKNDNNEWIVETDYYESNNIIVMPDAKDGLNGVDGKYGNSGTNGQDGYNSKDVSTATNSTFKGYIRLGLAGIGGYGGNGSHGGENYAGAGGGAPGFGGINGKISTGSDAHVINIRTLNIDDRDDLKHLKNVDFRLWQYGGNGGVGGLGSIKNGFIRYSSGGGGSGGFLTTTEVTEINNATEEDDDNLKIVGSEIVANGKTYQKVAGASGYFDATGGTWYDGTIGNYYGISTADEDGGEVWINTLRKHGFDGSLWSKVEPDLRDWRDNMNTDLRPVNMTDIKQKRIDWFKRGCSGGIGVESGGGTTTKQVYVSLRLLVKESWGWYGSTYEPMAWMSGERINSGGAAGLSGIMCK